MNPYIDRLLPYPFERLNALLATLTPNAAHERVSLSIGEPRHAAPDFVVAALADAHALRQSLATYPPTRGSDKLRIAIAGWLHRRFGVALDPATQVDGEAFAAGLYEREHIVVLPGAYLGREQDGVNPGALRVRLALVAPLDDCVAAARRVADFAATLR